MDAKDLRTESALSERNNDGSKYSQSGGIALHCDRNKSYQDIGSNSLAKVDVQSARPCAVIGPDRVVPPAATNEAYLKKGLAEPWPCMDSAYHTRRPPEYPHKLANFQNPTRNISPRQTFQENMQRIMVPPSYNSVKISDDTNYVQLPDRSNAIPKNIKINVPPEAKFCDVPYTVYTTNNEQKNVRNAEMCMSSVNPSLTRTGPHGWPPNSVNIRPTRTYGAPELYQYQEYPSCAGPRPVVPRPNRTVPEEPGYVYADPFYHQEGNVRFKPYPTVKDRFPQQRYEYIGNYTNSFHPPPAFPTHKYEMQKTVPPHPYPPYPPIKYLDRPPEPVMEGYQRNQQGSYNMPYRNQIIHPNYGPVLGNCPQNKIHSYPPDAHIKTLGPNKMPFDNAKAYIEYENGRPKMYPPSESYLVNEMGRVHSMKSQVIMPNYPTLNMHNIPPNPYYKKDNQQIKNYEYLQAHFRSMDPNINIHNPMIRHPQVFSPNTSAISPTDSSTSNDTSQTLGPSQEDCGYVSQSSTASARSIDSSINRIPNDCLRKYYDSRYGPIIRTAPMISKSELNSNNNPKEKKNIDVRQFLQMWNEGDEETEENNSKEIIIHSGPKNDSNFIKAHEVISQSNQEQLYVLGLVNVPSEELGKYEHIQKVSKLPENIKGYNHLELLNQFEEAIESSNMTNYKASNPTEYQMPTKVAPPKQTAGVMPQRPLSPLDVEAKISQSVIHKEVGCNFEIKPCSPKMLNVEVATPVQNLLTERAIEKVANPVMLKSPRLNGIDENMDCNIMKRKEHRVNISNDPVRIPSCKMVNTQFANNNSIDSIKNSYSLQDLESNSGLCLASLPRLDNDIELNFPEVNQQFINANKGDSSVSASLRDLPSLELLDQSDNQTKDKINNINSSSQVNNIVKSPCIMESEKESSKLSKYRKTKPHSSELKENQIHVPSVLNAARTDSVIIKNPDNVKNHEEKSSFSPNSLNKQVSDVQQVPINLTAQGNITENINKTPNSISPTDSIRCKENETPIEIAIDFSLNKNNNENIEDMDTINTKQTNNLSQDAIEENQATLVDDNIGKLPTFPDCDQNEDTFIDSNKIYKNDMPSPIKCSEDLDTQITKDKDFADLSLTESPQLEDIFTKNKCNVKEMKEIDDGILSMTSVNEINNVSSNSLLPIEFVTPDAELLQADCASDSYLMDIDKQSDIVDTQLDEPKNIIMENVLRNCNKKNEDKFDHKDVSTDDVTDIEKNSIENRDDVVNNKNVLNSELDIKESKDSVNRNSDYSMSEGSANTHCNNFDLENSSIVKNCQTNNKKQSTDPNHDFTSPSNIVTHSQHEYQTNAEDQDVVTNNCNELHSKTTNQDAKVSPSLSESILSPKEYVPELSQQKCYINLQDANLKLDSPNDTIMENREDNQPALLETDAELSCPNNVTTANPEDCQAKVNEPVIHNLVVTQTSNDERAMSLEQQSVSNFDLSPPGHVVVYKEISNNDNTASLLKDISDNEMDFSITDDICQKDNFENDLNISTRLKTEMQTGEDKYDNLDIKFLSYGGKEMYSPWIQKLVMFCEGSINSISKDSEEHSNNIELIEAKLKGIETCDFDIRSNKDENTLNNIIHSGIDNSSPAIQMGSSNTLKINDVPVAKENADVNINTISEEECKIAENEDNNIIESNTMLDENEEILTQNERTCTFSPDNKNTICHTSTDSLLTNDLEKHYDKIDSLVNSKEVEGCLSPNVDEEWDTQSNGSNVISEQWDKQSNCSDSEPAVTNKTSDIKYKINQRWGKQSDDSSDIIPENLSNPCKQNNVDPNLWDSESTCNHKTSEQSDEINCAEDVTERWDKQSNGSVDVSEQWDKQSSCSDGLPETWDKQSNCSDVVPEKGDKQSAPDDELLGKQSNSSNEIPIQWNQEFSETNEMLEKTNRQTNSIIIEEQSTIIENEELVCTKIQTSEHIFNKKRQPLKRSLSDSALNVYNNNNEHSQQENEENVQFIWPFKRRKVINNDILAQNLCNIIQSNRRNSISSFYNEENVSFCILIDNDCIITEEENEEQEKICYTELSGECLAEIQEECTKDEKKIETMTEVISDISAPQQEDICEYSDSFIMQGDDEKLEETWVEDVACVETVISDDIAEDIEISEPISPKDDVLSDNDESGVFSSSDHTDKVKYIYGDKMCNDDAQFVETLYNTPQMDVNKTLVQRETLISGEYYDNDSLEKILSESNDRVLSPCVPDYTEPVYSPVNVKETVENKENMAVEMISPNKANTLDVVDTGIEKIHQEDVKLCELFDETQDDTVHSCESSVDNVFAYKENDENTKYTSSSPEVSSTTSEEKKSAILLKITNYQGSRISQINDSNRDSKRPSCKFTEDKDYVQSQSNFSSHRPLLTKAAQKYIPPLKESMRDLKVKLSLPQHSLMKLKQLKISKDEPKLCKPNTAVPRISKKPKPKFEDVLKSIDEIQIKMHKEKNKKSKKSIPKVVIKKNENGSHYASTSNKEEFNPDLTGRKWQPWVFIEKNHFIDKMAVKKKTKAIYSHRKRTYVLAEKFQKYKSVNSGKFVISPPISDCASAGLKYTIRLKHNY